MVTTGVRFETELCRVLGTEYPVLQSGMGGVAGPELVAEVSEAGGLGILSGTLISPRQLREDIRAVRERTDRPFGVNLLLLPELRQPASADVLAAADVAAVHRALAPLRDALGLPANDQRPPTVPDLISPALQVVVEERVAVFSAGLGDPGAEVVAACHEVGTKVVAMVTSVADARVVASAGVDAVVAQGLEAGGHRSHFTKPADGTRGDLGALALVPEVVDAVSVPVVAAGGIVDGRGLVAALALGASGVLLGSRFLVTRESIAPDAHKKALLERTGADTVVTDTISGRYARALRNPLTDRYAEAGAPVLPFPAQFLATADVRTAGAEQGDADYVALWSGQGVGRIQDVPWAGDVVRQIVDEARRLLAGGLAERVRLEER